MTTYAVSFAHAGTIAHIADAETPAAAVHAFLVSANQATGLVADDLDDVLKTSEQGEADYIVHALPFVVGVYDDVAADDTEILDGCPCVAAIRVPAQDFSEEIAALNRNDEDLDRYGT